jgi:hypothetical protein
MAGLLVLPRVSAERTWLLVNRQIAEVQSGEKADRELVRLPYEALGRDSLGLPRLTNVRLLLGNRLTFQVDFGAAGTSPISGLTSWQSE